MAKTAIAYFDQNFLFLWLRELHFFYAQRLIDFPHNRSLYSHNLSSFRMAIGSSSVSLKTSVMIGVLCGTAKRFRLEIIQQVFTMVSGELGIHNDLLL
jgi:hypothetical protein